MRLIATVLNLLGLALLLFNATLGATKWTEKVDNAIRRYLLRANLGPFWPAHFLRFFCRFWPKYWAEAYREQLHRLDLNPETLVAALLFILAGPARFWNPISSTIPLELALGAIIVQATSFVPRRLLVLRVGAALGLVRDPADWALGRWAPNPRWQVILVASARGAVEFPIWCILGMMQMIALVFFVLQIILSILLTLPLGLLFMTTIQLSSIVNRYTSKSRYFKGLRASPFTIASFWIVIAGAVLQLLAS